MLTHFDLFSGIGGFAVACQWAGFETVGFSEIDPFCCKVLDKNFPGIKNYGDIRDLKSPQHVDLITAGIPCQPFSQAGSKKGIKDDRYLWPQTRDIIIKARPQFIIIENVCGIINMEFDNILDELARNDYETISFVLPAVAANAPHRRDRVWLIAHDHSIGSNLRLDNWEAGQLQAHINGHVAQIQQKWAQFKPHAWSIYTARDWLTYNCGASGKNNGVPSRMDKDRIKALGNAIVPQVVYPILEFIKMLHHE